MASNNGCVICRPLRVLDKLTYVWEISNLTHTPNNSSGPEVISSPVFTSEGCLVSWVLKLHPRDQAGHVFIVELLLQCNAFTAEPLLARYSLHELRDGKEIRLFDSDEWVEFTEGRSSNCVCRRFVTEEDLAGGNLTIRCDVSMQKWTCNVAKLSAGEQAPLVQSPCWGNLIDPWFALHALVVLGLIWHRI